MASGLTIRNQASFQAPDGGVIRFKTFKIHKKREVFPLQQKLYLFFEMHSFYK